MGNDQPSWDEMPSLGELKIDWDFEPENPMGKRSYARLEADELYQLFETREIPVKLVTEYGQDRALLVNVSQGGISLQTTSANYTESQLVKLGFFLGKQKVISKGRIRNIRQEQGLTLLGIEFIGLPDINHAYIAGMYSSLKIKK